MSITRLLQFGKHISQYCNARFAPLAQAHGLSMREMDVLLFLINNPDYDTAKEITEYRGISKSQVSQAVDFLVELGYLERRSDREDRRLIHLTLTREGRVLAEKGQALQTQCVQALFSDLSEAEIQAFEDSWERIFDRAEELSLEVSQ